MDHVMTENMLRDSQLDTVMQDNIHSFNTNTNGHLQNGFVDPRALESTEPSNTTNQFPGTADDETPSQSQHSSDIATQTTHRKLSLPTGCCYDIRMKYHANADFSENPHHPEDPRRIESIMKEFSNAGLLFEGKENELAEILKDSPTKYMWRIPARVAREDEVCTVHTASHFNWVKDLSNKSPKELREMTEWFDAGRKSLYVGSLTYYAALISAGGAIETCKNVVEGRVKNAIAVIRPPGHHAEPSESMGFCIFNNVPIAASVCMQDYPDVCRKILILDWDVHHGNGIQNMFYENPNVLYISLHVYQNGLFYPGQPDDEGIPDGGPDKRGAGVGIGKNVNIAWHDQGMGDGEYMAAFQKLVMPIAHEFDPDLVIISAGFDAAAGDDLGGCYVTPACYSHMTHMLMSLANGKVAVCLEGGYNLRAISRSALAVAKTLMGEPPERMVIPPLNEKAARDIQHVKEYQAPYWECMRPGVIPIKDLQHRNAPRLHDVMRAYQKGILSKKHNMISMPIMRKMLSKSFADQVLVTPRIQFAKKVILIVHDSPEIVAQADSLNNSVEAHNAFMGDDLMPYIDWAIENGFGVVDVNIPQHVTSPQDEEAYIPRPQEPAKEQQSKELLCYLWDNYLQLNDSASLTLMGVGDAYLGIKQLLISRDVKSRVPGVLSFVSGSLRPVRSETDTYLSSWYKASSLIFVSSDHSCWNDEENARKVRKNRFGAVEKSEVTGLGNMLKRYEGKATKWVLDKVEEWEWKRGDGESDEDEVPLGQKVIDEADLVGMS
ncbi:Histone deacetylase [Lachnellula hyalina]|uniref:Histone deacetylase n=1 Tax=Lachnellula hyalina TaxID=1316788 RepID=A0A8H8R4P2_9HELO|nr:Histone deacetylase [Lachnellula hyalina]TVY27665.1 Histone deacetylase [Lachnellula hyalina]